MQQPGHRRDILDRIRDSLKPFEQNYEVQMFGSPNPSTSFSSNSFGNSVVSGEKSDDTQMMMINALTNIGFDKVGSCYLTRVI